MSGHLSFAQILQKKKSNNSTANSRISTTPPNQLFSSKPAQQYLQHHPTKQISQQFPTLAQMVDQYSQFPNQPEQSFILSFRQLQSSYGNGSNFQGSQGFQVGVNALDSFIMSKSYLNSQRNNKKPSQQVIPLKKVNKTGNKQFNLVDIGKKFLIAKQNNNFNSKAYQNDDAYKFSSKTYRERSQKQSLQASQQQFVDDSKKYGPTSPSSYTRPVNNKQMFVNTKIIQSQAYYQNEDMKKSKNSNVNLNINIPKIERSERVDDKKLSRYQINYQQTQRKQEPQPLLIKQRQQNKFIQSKSQQNMVASQNKSKSPIILKSKLTKKQSQQQSLLIQNEQMMSSKAKKYSQIQQPIQRTNDMKKAQSNIEADMKQQRQMQDAKKLINQILQIRQKVQPKNTNHTFTKLTNQSNFAKNKVASIIDRIIQNTQPYPIKAANVNYSFANQLPAMNPIQHPHTNKVEDSFSGAVTKKQLQQIQQQNKFCQNQKMLSCIQYTHSEADIYDDADDHQKQQQSILLQLKKNKQVRQSIPEPRKKTQQEIQYQTLQKYLPKNSEKKAPNHIKYPQNIIPKQLQMPAYAQKSSQIEYSQVMEKIQVQPSFEKPHKQPKDIHNSGNLKFLKQVQVQDGGCYDASSIDIQISDNSSQLFLTNQLNSAQRQFGILKKPSVQSQKLNIPQLNLNISDIQSISNISHPSQQSPQKKQPLLKLSDKKNQPSYKFPASEVESNPPLSSNESLNIHKHQSSHGFIYRMRIGSRNSSFTSDYNYGGVAHDNLQKDQSHNFGGSNHSSLNIKQQKYNQIDSQEQGNNNVPNMTKNKHCMQIQLSLSNTDNVMQPTYKSKQQAYESEQYNSRAEEYSMEAPVLAECVNNSNIQQQQAVGSNPPGQGQRYEQRFTVQSISIYEQPSLNTINQYKYQYQQTNNPSLSLKQSYQQQQSNQQVLEYNQQPQQMNQDKYEEIQVQVQQVQVEQKHQIIQDAPIEQPLQQNISQETPLTQYNQYTVYKSKSQYQHKYQPITYTQQQQQQPTHTISDDTNTNTEPTPCQQQPQTTQSNNQQCQQNTMANNQQVQHTCQQKNQELQHNPTATYTQYKQQPNIHSKQSTQQVCHPPTQHVPEPVPQPYTNHQSQIITEQVVIESHVDVQNNSNSVGIVKQQLFKQQLPLKQIQNKQTKPIQNIEQQKQKRVQIARTQPQVTMELAPPALVVTPSLQQNRNQLKSSIMGTNTKMSIKSSIRNSINFKNKQNRDEEPFQFDLDF